MQWHFENFLLTKQAEMSNTFFILLMEDIKSLDGNRQPQGGNFS